MSDLSPHQLIVQIDADARALDAGGRQLAKAIKDLSTVEANYQEQEHKALIGIHHQAKESGERMPAEDVRRALAHQQVDRTVYGAYLAKRAEVDALRAWTRAVEGALSARQSLLNALRAELGATR